MAVFCRSRHVLAVIDVEDRDLIFADHPVKLPDDIIKMGDDIITAVAGVACVKADPELIAVFYAVIDAGQFLKRTSDLRAFSSHCLKGDKAAGVCCQDFVQPLDDLFRPPLCPFSYVSAGMENEDAAAAAYSPIDLFSEKFGCKGKCFRLYCISEIDDVRSVNDDLMDAVLFHILPCGIDVQLADFFPAGVLRCAGIEHKCVSAV